MRSPCAQLSRYTCAGTQAAQPGRQAGYRRLDEPHRFIECAICNAAAEQGSQPSSPEHVDVAGHDQMSHQVPYLPLRVPKTTRDGSQDHD